MADENDNQPMKKTYTIGHDWFTKQLGDNPDAFEVVEITNTSKTRAFFEPLTKTLIGEEQTLTVEVKGQFAIDQLKRNLAQAQPLNGELLKIIERNVVPLTEIHFSADTIELKVGESAILKAFAEPSNSALANLTWSADSNGVELEPLDNDQVRITAKTTGDLSVTAFSNEISNRVAISVKDADKNSDGGDNNGSESKDHDTLVFNTKTLDLTESASPHYLYVSRADGSPITANDDLQLLGSFPEYTIDGLQVNTHGNPNEPDALLISYDYNESKVDKSQTEKVKLTVQVQVNGTRMNDLTVELSVFKAKAIERQPFSARLNMWVDEAQYKSDQKIKLNTNVWSEQNAEEAPDLTFVSSNTNVLTVDQSGFVTLVGAGKATVTATQTIGSTVASNTLGFAVGKNIAFGGQAESEKLRFLVAKIKQFDFAQVGSTASASTDTFGDYQPQTDWTNSWESLTPDRVSSSSYGELSFVNQGMATLKYTDSLGLLAERSFTIYSENMA